MALLDGQRIQDRVAENRGELNRDLATCDSNRELPIQRFEVASGLGEDVEIRQRHPPVNCDIKHPQACGVLDELCKPKSNRVSAVGNIELVSQRPTSLSLVKGWISGSTNAH